QMRPLRRVLTCGAAELSYRYVETPIRSGAIGRYLSRYRTAHGERRRRIARLGGVVALASTAAVLALGAGLANAQGETPHIPGIAAHANDNGPGADPGTIKQIRARTHHTLPTSATRPPRDTGSTGTSGRP